MTVKKIVAGALVAGALAWGLAPGVQASNGKSEVTGVITHNQTAVADVKVSVTCNSKTKTDITDSGGSYLVTFNKSECDFSSIVKVLAQKDGKSGMASGTMQSITTKLNLAIINVSVPEFGAIGFMTAGVAGLGFMGYMRRRQLQSQN